MCKITFAMAMLTFLLGSQLESNTDVAIHDSRLKQLVGGDPEDPGQPCIQDGGFRCNGATNTNCNGGCLRVVNGVSIVGCIPLDNPITMPPALLNPPGTTVGGANTQYEIEVQDIPLVVPSNGGYFPESKYGVGNWFCFVVYKCACQSADDTCQRGVEVGRTPQDIAGSMVDGEWGECFPGAGS